MMNGLIRFLASTPKIENLFVVIGKNYGKYMIEDLIREIRYNKITFFVNNKSFKRDAKKITEDINEKDSFQNTKQIDYCDFETVFSLSELPPKSALLFYQLGDARLIFNLAKLKPDFLIGSLERGSISSFEVWEAFRENADKIIIDTYGGGKKDEILNWTRRPGSDIELSVIYPMYNIAKYLDKCIETTTAWKADYVEFLFVDDGSPDNCAEIVEKAMKKDPRIKLLRKQNGGCASARQFGLEKAKGRYIGFIDPDDYIDETMYRRLLKRAMVGNYDIAYCGYTEVYTETGESCQVQDFLNEPYLSGVFDDYKIKSLCAFANIGIWRRIYSKEMIQRAKIHFYTDIRRFDDLPFKFETFAAARSVVAIPDHLYFYQMGRPGQDVSANDERLFVHFQIFKYLDEFVKTKGTYFLLEMLQIVKLQTHKYAISKILPEYLEDYLRQAQEDLKTLFSPADSKLIYSQFLGKNDVKIFTAIIDHDIKKIKRYNR